MFLDRQLQLAILKELQAAYPSQVSVQMMSFYSDDNFIQINQNLFYLLEHELIKGRVKPNRTGKKPDIAILMASITAAGLDFLEDDGGLGAILNKVVVKFDDADFKLLLKTIEQSDADPDVKSKLTDMLKSLPAEGLKSVYSRLVTLGLDNMPAAIRLIEKAIEHC